MALWSRNECQCSENKILIFYVSIEILMLKHFDNLVGGVNKFLPVWSDLRHSRKQILTSTNVNGPAQSTATTWSLNLDLTSQCLTSKTGKFSIIISMEKFQKNLNCFSLSDFIWRYSFQTWRNLNGKLQNRNFPSNNNSVNDKISILRNFQKVLWKTLM